MVFYHKSFYMSHMSPLSVFKTPSPCMTLLGVLTDIYLILLGIHVYTPIV